MTSNTTTVDSSLNSFANFHKAMMRPDMSNAYNQELLHRAIDTLISFERVTDEEIGYIKDTFGIPRDSRMRVATSKPVFIVTPKNYIGNFYVEIDITKEDSTWAVICKNSNIYAFISSIKRPDMTDPVVKELLERAIKTKVSLDGVTDDEMNRIKDIFGISTNSKIRIANCSMYNVFGGEKFVFHFIPPNYYKERWVEADIYNNDCDWVCIPNG